MILPRSTILYGAAVAITLAAFGSYAYGVGVGRAREQAAQHRADQAADKARGQLQDKIDIAAQASQQREYARQSIVREIHHESQKVIEHPVYSALCVDADGVGLLDRAAASANADDIWGVAGDTRPIADRPAD